MQKLFAVGIGIGILALSSPSRAAEGGKTSAEYWKAIELPFSTFSAMVTTKSCYTDATKFIKFTGCVEGLNGALAHSRKSLQLISADRLKAEPGLGTIEESFGAVKLIKRKKLKAASEVEFMKAMKKEREASTKAWEALYNDKLRVVEFTAIADYVKDKIVPAAEESEYTASAINALYRVVLDPHARIQPIDEFLDSMKVSKSSFYGIGAQIQVIDEKLIIRLPVDGSPALKAGLRAGDVIEKVDGKSVDGIPLEEAIGLIKGKAGTEVVLTILRKGASMQVKVTRGEIISKNVEGKSLSPEVTYFKVDNFVSKDTCSDLKDGLATAVKAGAKGFILDLRNNGGGLLSEAVCLTNLFVEKGKVVVSRKNLKSNRTVSERTKDDRFTDLPLVTLVNAGSASASEIVAGALQDMSRSLIVGERSFGKGTVQAPFKWDVEGVALFQTIERFYLPSGRTTQIEGVSPDLTVFRAPEPTEEDKLSFREEDAYTNALPFVGATWKQLRPEYVEKVQKCVDTKGTAKKRFADLAGEAQPPDYQLLYAEDTLACAAQ